MPGAALTFWGASGALGSVMLAMAASAVIMLLVSIHRFVFGRVPKVEVVMSRAALLGLGVGASGDSTPRARNSMDMVDRRPPEVIQARRRGFETSQESPVPPRGSSCSPPWFWAQTSVTKPSTLLEAAVPRGGGSIRGGG